MYRCLLQRGGALVVASLLVILLACGCDDDSDRDNHGTPTVIDNLYDSCLADSESCVERTASVTLYLDTINLPDSEEGDPYLYMQALPGIGGQHDVLAYQWSGSFPDSLYNELVGEGGWKIAISGANIVFCVSCYDNSGYVTQIILTGPTSAFAFKYDPADTLEVFAVLD